MTDNAVMAFDPAALKKRVAESVQSQFGMLIPAEQFDAMVAAEIKAYFETETQHRVLTEEQGEYSYNGRQKVNVVYVTMTPFRQQVREAIAKQVAQLIQNHFNTDKFRATVDSVWNSENQNQGYEAKMSDMLERKIDEIAPKMASSMFRELFVSAVERAKIEAVQEISKNLPR